MMTERPQPARRDNGPSRGSEGKRRFGAAGGILFSLIMVAKVVALLLEGHSYLHWSIPQRILCLAVPLVSTYLGITWYLGKSLHGTILRAQEVDIALLLGVFLPPVNTMIYGLAMPSFDVTVPCWPLVLCFIIVRGALLDLPPAEALVMLAANLPFIMFLDFSKTCRLQHEGAAGVPQHWSALLARYLVMQGLPMLLMGLAAAILSGLFLGHAQLVPRGSIGGTVSMPPLDEAAAATAATAQCKAAAQDGLQPPGSPAPPATRPDLPLESLGIHVLAALGLRQPLLAYERWFVSLDRAMDVNFVLRMVCLPTCCFYTCALMAAVFGVKFASRVTPEELLLVMVGWFLLGREAAKLEGDLQAVVGLMQSRLRACRILLADLLPEHVVKRILQRQPPVAAAGRSPSEQHPQGSLQHEQQQHRHHHQQQQEQQRQQQQQQEQQLAQHVVHTIHTDADAKTELFHEVEEEEEPCRAPELGPDPDSTGLVCEPLTQHQPGTNQHQPDLTLDTAALAAVEQRSQLLLPKAACSSSRCIKVSIQGATGLLSTPGGNACTEICHPASIFDRGVASLTQISRGLIQRATTSAGGRNYGRDDADSDGDSDDTEMECLVRELDSCCRPSRIPGGNTPHWLQDNQVGDSHECVTIFFSDICGFSTWANKLAPEKVMSTLNDLYCRLDDIILNEFTSLYKIETIGDAYVMAANLMQPDADHAANAVRFALRAREEAGKVLRPDMDDGSTLQMRIGLHSGPVVSGIIGKVRRRFCLFGDTMNMAARTESSCPPGAIQLTEATHALMQPAVQSGSWLVLQERGEVEVKGSDKPLRMYLASRQLPLARRSCVEEQTSCLHSSLTPAKSIAGDGECMH